MVRFIKQMNQKIKPVYVQNHQQSCNKLIMHFKTPKKEKTVFISKTLPNELEKTQLYQSRSEEEATKQLHQISNTDSQNFLDIKINKWMKYSQTKSQKQQNQNLTSGQRFNDTAMRTIKNEKIPFQKKDIVLRNKKFLRGKQFKNSLKNSIRNTEIISYRIPQVNTINLQKKENESKTQRIHSQSIQLNMNSKLLKIQPKNLFQEAEVIVKSKQKEGRKLRSVTGKSMRKNVSKRHSCAQALNSKQIRHSSLSQEPKQKCEKASPPLVHLKKFMNYINDLRKQQTQKIAETKIFSIVHPKMTRNVLNHRNSTIS